MSVCSSSLPFVNLRATRFVDRDMVMRYHPGLAVGHRYNTGQSTRTPASTGNVDISQDQTAAMTEAKDDLVPNIEDFPSNDESDSDDSEFLFGDQEDDAIDADDNFEDEDEVYAKSDDEEFLAMNEMYGF
jgi:hypothetical protein